MSGPGPNASDGLRSGWFVLNVRLTARRCGPVWGERPVCCASIWYIGLPTTPPAATAGDGEALATTPADGDGPTDAAGFAMGLTAAAAAEGEPAGDAAGAAAVVGLAGA